MDSKLRENESTFAPELPVRKSEGKRSHILGLQENEKTILDIIYPPNEQNEFEGDVDEDAFNE